MRTIVDEKPVKTKVKVPEDSELKAMMKKGYNVDKSFYDDFKTQVEDEGEVVDRLDKMIAERTEQIHEDYRKASMIALHK